MKEFVEFVETQIEPTDAKEEVKKEESRKKGNKRMSTAVWKRKHEKIHAVEAVNSAINNLELECEENSAGVTSEFSS